MIQSFQITSLDMFQIQYSKEHQIMELEVKLLAETKEKLEKLRSNPTTTNEQISLAEADLKTFEVSVQKFLS